MNPPPPASSPKPNFPGVPDGDSHEHKLSAHEYRIRMEEWQQRIAEDRLNEERKAAAAAAVAKGQAEADAFWRRLWTIGGSAVVLVLGTIGTLAWGSSKIDAGVAPVKADLEEHKQKEQKLEDRLGNVERISTRSEAMLEMLTKNRGMRPPPKELPDGGS